MNQLKKRAESFRTSLLEKQLRLGDNFLQIIGYFGRFVLAAILANAKIAGGASPFALSFTAASGTGINGLTAAVGSICGYMFSGDFIWALKYIATIVLIYSANQIFHNTKLERMSCFMPLCTCFLTACTGFVYLSDGGWQLEAVSVFCTETVLSGGCGALFRQAMKKWTIDDSGTSEDVRHGVSLVVLSACVLTAFSGLRIFGIISAARCAAVLCILVAAYEGGVGAGCVCGIIMGAAMDAALSEPPVFSMIYTFSALVAGAFTKRDRLLFCIAYITADAVAVLWTWELFSGTSALYETFISTVIFMLLPGRALLKVGVLLSGNGSGYGILKAREYTKERVRRTSEAFHDLYEMVREAAGEEKNDNDIASVFDLAAESVCRRCIDSGRCWQQNYEKTVGVLNDVTETMCEKGRLEERDFPIYFSAKCRKMPELTEAINREYRSLLYRRQFRSRLRENQGAVFNQYAEISDILGDITDELGGAIRVGTKQERKLQKYLRGKNIEASTAVFRDRTGRLHAEIYGGGVYKLRRERDYLNRLSQLLEMRLCTSETDEAKDRLVLLEAEPLAASIGIASIKKKGQAVNGDKGTYFKTDEGVLYVVLSDGMGTGEGAAKSSEDVIKVLERFLRAGIKPDTALKILNDILLLKNENETVCAAIDLMSLDLFTGELKLFKYGGAPSYIRKGSVVRRVKSRSFSAGLGSCLESAPECIKMTMSPDSFAIITSDGVTAGDDDGWLCSAVASFQGKNVKEMSKMLLRTATEKFGCEDDMTVVAIYMEDRE